MPAAAEDLTGRTFGLLEVLRRAETRQSSGISRWIVRCSCHAQTVYEITRSHLLSKNPGCCACRADRAAATRLAGTNDADGAIKILRAHYRQSALKNSREFSLESLGVFSHLVLGKCHYCNTLPQRERFRRKRRSAVPLNGIDRVDNEQGYSLKNSVPCCTVCNRAKRKMELSSFATYHQRIREIALGRKYDDPEYVLKEWQAKHLLLVEELKQVDEPKVDRKGQYAFPGVTPVPEKATARKVRRKLVELNPEDSQLELPL